MVGETYPIKNRLKELGGFWNKWEKGWEYAAIALPQLTEFLTALSGVNKQETEEEQRRHPNFEAAHPLNICDTESSQYKEAANEYLTPTADFFQSGNLTLISNAG